MMTAGFPAETETPRTDSRSDTELLSAFVEQRDERAFAELTLRHAGLVFHTALRRTGDAGLAEEVTQSAFALLARKAASLTGHPSLSAWLHRSAFWLAGDAAARESAHRRRMKSYAENAALHAAGEDPLASALPHLDGALQSLRESDRRLILLRFHEGLSFQVIGERLHQPHDSARKATQRAVERLGHALRRSGVVLPGVTLASALSAALTPPVPAAVLAALPSSALAAAGSLGGKTLLLNSLHAMTAAKQTATAAALVALFVLPTLAYQHRAEIRRVLAGSVGAIADPRGSGGSGVPNVDPGSVSAGPPRAAAVVDVAALLRGVNSAEDPWQAAALAAMEIVRMESSQISACLSALREIKNSGLRRELALGLYGRWAEADPAAALNSALGDGGEGNSGTVAVAMKVWMSRDPDQATAWLEQAGGPALERVMLCAHEALREVSPEKLAAMVNSLPEDQQCFLGWNFPTREPELSQGMLLKLTSESARKAFLTPLSSGDLTGKPEALLAWGREHLQGEEQQQLVSGSLRNWAVKDPAAAFAWYQAQPEGSLPRKALEGFAKLPAAEYGKFRQGLPQEERREWDFQRAEIMPGADAAPLLDSLPEGKRKENLYTSTAEKWAESNPGGASVWVDALPPGSGRDQAAAGLSAGLKSLDPEAAILWAGSIGDPAVRAKTTAARWREWIGTDASGAWRWLRQSEIDPATRTLIQALNDSPLK